LLNHPSLNHVTASQDRHDDVTGVTIDHAAELLRPYLFPAVGEPKDVRKSQD
jgi:hypothetical protein